MLFAAILISNNYASRAKEMMMDYEGMTDDELNMAIAVHIMGWVKPDGPEPKCPECDGSLRRQKCLWEMGGDCPRHRALFDYEQSLKPMRYTASLGNATTVEARIKETVLEIEYAVHLTQIVLGDDYDLDLLPTQMFAVVTATARQRMIAALMTMEASNA